MNIRESMGIKTLQGARGTITKVEMQSCNGEVWYDLRIKPNDTGDRFGDYIGKRIEWHGLEKEICISILSLLAVRIYRRLV